MVFLDKTTQRYLYCCTCNPAYDRLLHRVQRAVTTNIAMGVRMQPQRYLNNFVILRGKKFICICLEHVAEDSFTRSSWAFPVQLEVQDSIRNWENVKPDDLVHIGHLQVSLIYIVGAIKSDHVTGVHVVTLLNLHRLMKIKYTAKGPLAGSRPVHICTWAN